MKGTQFSISPLLYTDSVPRIFLAIIRWLSKYGILVAPVLETSRIVQEHVLSSSMSIHNSISAAGPVPILTNE